MKTFALALVCGLCLSGCSEHEDPKPATSTSALGKQPPKNAGTSLEAKSGPFGFEMGMSAEEIKALVKSPAMQEARSFMMFSTVPKPYQGFENYLVMAGARSGLCKISAVGEVKSNSFGHQVDDRFNQLAAALRKKYGAPQTQMNGPIPGSIWNAPNDYMMGLLKEERIVAMIWNSEKAKLPDGLSSIVLEANGVSSDTANVRVSYSFSNFDQCLAEEKALQDSAL